jgi:hypothetical protein
VRGGRIEDRGRLEELELAMRGGRLRPRKKRESLKPGGSYRSWAIAAPYIRYAGAVNTPFVSTFSKSAGETPLRDPIADASAIASTAAPSMKCPASLTTLARSGWIPIRQVR